MWFWGASFALVLQLAAAALIGERLVTWLPWRMRAATTLFLSPPLGLAVLVLAATLTGWLAKGYDQRWCLVLTLLLAMATLVGQRRASAHPRRGLRLLLLGAFALLAAFPVLCPLLRFGGYNPFNDTFTYLTHGQWLQTHGFSEPIMERSYHPVLSQVSLYQTWGLRMGASFYLAWSQALFGLPRSLEIYPSVAALALVCGGLAVGAVVIAVCPQRRVEAWLCALATAVTLNGFAYGAVSGFLPQTFGVAFAAGVVALRRLEISHGRRAEPSGFWRAALPHAVLIAAAIFC